jgi:hypothetical protein
MNGLIILEYMKDADKMELYVAAYGGYMSLRNDNFKDFGSLSWFSVCLPSALVATIIPGKYSEMLMSLEKFRNIDGVLPKLFSSRRKRSYPVCFNWEPGK